MKQKSNSIKWWNEENVEKTTLSVKWLLGMYHVLLLISLLVEATGSN